jgi:pyruvate-formate lyase
MAKFTRAGIRFSEPTLDAFPLLAQLRKQLEEGETEVCIERARHLTTYLRDLADPQDPPILQYAKAARCYLANKAPRFFDGNLLAGTTTSKRFGAPVYPDQMEPTVWSELDPRSLREWNLYKLSADEAEELKLKIFPYWRECGLHADPQVRSGHSGLLDLISRIVFSLGNRAVFDSEACCRVVLEQGLDRLIQQAAEREEALLRKDGPEDAATLVFYQAAQEVLSGLITYAANLGRFAELLAGMETDPERKWQLEDMAGVCAQVPAKPARSFREAVNALWLLQIGLHAESVDRTMNLGRLDQLLYPWYREDVEAGALSANEAMELIGCLWLKFNDNTSLVPEEEADRRAGPDPSPAVALGNTGSDGQEAGNDLTHLMVCVTKLLWIPRPRVTVNGHRVDRGEARARGRADVKANTLAAPATSQAIFLNSDPPLEQACPPEACSALERFWNAFKASRRGSAHGDDPSSNPALVRKRDTAGMEELERRS